jgi:hypothetical protein
VKRCCECGVTKPLTKFHGVMARCKACHNGVTEANSRRAAEVLPPRERQPGEPDEDQIRLLCMTIQQRWSANKRESRKKGRALA